MVRTPNISPELLELCYRLNCAGCEQRCLSRRFPVFESQQQDCREFYQNLNCGLGNVKCLLELLVPLLAQNRDPSITSLLSTLGNNQCARNFMSSLFTTIASTLSPKPDTTVVVPQSTDAVVVAGRTAERNPLQLGVIPPTTSTSTTQNQLDYAKLLEMLRTLQNNRAAAEAYSPITLPQLAKLLQALTALQNTAAIPRTSTSLEAPQLAELLNLLRFLSTTSTQTVASRQLQAVPAQYNANLLNNYQYWLTYYCQLYPQLCNSYGTTALGVNVGLARCK